MARWRSKVLIGPKVDLDTVGCAFLMGVTRDDRVGVVQSGRALEPELSDPSVLCIEVGGSGRVAEACFDHHDVGGPKDSATLQAWNWIDRVSHGGILGWFKRNQFQIRDFVKVSLLVEYINRLDVSGPQALGQEPRAEDFPYLSDVFAGMLLTERDPIEQLHKGVEILREVIQIGQDPYGTIKGFDDYATAKAENNRQVTKAVESAKWTTTTTGRKLGYLETDFFGAPGALYGQGAEIVIAFSPQFGNPPVPKFTVAGNGIRVDAVLPALNALEQGWGGPATGTIIGSSRSGSHLTLYEVVEIVEKNL